MHGWILAYDKNSLQQTGVFNVTPNGQNGGVWNDGNPLQVDSKGNLYTETGNGTFDAKLNRNGFPSRSDYGDSVLKLALRTWVQGAKRQGNPGRGLLSRPAMKPSSASMTATSRRRALSSCPMGQAAGTPKPRDRLCQIGQPLHHQSK